MSIQQKAIMFVVIGIIVIFVLTPTSLLIAKEKKDLVYAAFGTGSTLFQNAAMQGTVLNKYSNLNVSVSTTSGAFAIIPLLESGQAQLGTLQGNHLWVAPRAVGGFNKQYTSLRILQAGYLTQQGWSVLASSKIKTIEDLRGKKVAWSIKGLGPYQSNGIIGYLSLLAYGIDPVKDVIPIENESIAKAGIYLELGITDATCSSILTGSLVELNARKGVRALPFPKEKMRIFEKYALGNVFGHSYMPKDSLVGAGVPCAHVPTFVTTTEGLDEETAYTVVKTLIEHQGDLIATNPTLGEQWGLSDAAQKTPIPYHPGAIKYYRERGVWSKEIEDNQRELLKNWPPKIEEGVWKGIPPVK